MPHNNPEHLRALWDDSPTGLLVYDGLDRLAYANGAARDMCGLQAEAQPPPVFFDATGHDLPAARHPVARARTMGRATDSRLLQCRDGAGQRRHVRVTAKPLPADEGPDGVALFLLDAAGEVLAADKLRESEGNIRRFFEATPVGICITDDQGYFEYANQAYLRLYGYELDEILARHFTMVVPAEHKQALSKLHDDFIAGREELTGEFDVVTAQGEARSILAGATRIRGFDGRLKKITFVQDFTDHRQLEREMAEKNRLLEELSTKDPLTGLFNRRHADEILRTEIKRAERYQEAVSVALFDLDRFKRVNDEHGHACGDEVLVETARMAVAHLRQTDTVARYGGEEFLVVFANTPGPAATDSMERFRATVAAYVHACTGVAVTVSAGVASWRPGDSLEGLLKRADERLYAAKEAGRDRVVGGG